MRKIIISLFLFPCFLGWPPGGGLARAEALKLAPDAPDRYVVQKGDTLWAISGRFLQSPWRWPELWGMNKDQIKNPHLIYPGDVLVLDRRGAEGPRLSKEMETVKRPPRVRVEASPREAIPTIAASDLQPFLAKPLVVDAQGLDGAPRIVALQEGRVIASAGDLVSVVGLPRDQGRMWDIYEPGNPLQDPASGEVLGYEAVYLGTGRVFRHEGKSAILQIVRSSQEILIGARLVRATEPTPMNFVPKAPQRQVSGLVISAYGGNTEAGPTAVVAINKGERDGLAPGDVLRVRAGQDRATVERGRASAAVPDLDIGLLMVFRTFDRVSYALVMQATRQVAPLDRVENP